MQLYSVMEEGLYEKSPIVSAWLKRVRDETNPVFDQAHKIVYAVRDMYKGMAKLWYDDNFKNYLAIYISYKRNCPDLSGVLNCVYSCQSYDEK